MAKRKAVKKNTDILDKKAREIHEQMKKQVDLDLIERGISSNEFEFIYEEKTYKVSKPTYIQKHQAYEAKLKRHYEMLLDDKYVPEELLIKQYARRGINLDEYDKTIQTLEANKNVLKMKLGKGIDDGISESTLHKYREEIERLSQEQQNLSIKKQTYLELSIETQCNIYLYNYLTMLITEEKVDENSWKRVWDSYDDFMKSDEGFILQACFFASLMIHNEVSF